MNVEPTQKTREVEFLKRIVRPRLTNLTPEAAKAILALRLDDWDRQRMHQLAVKNREGRLTLEDEHELESYLRVGSFLDLMRAKALGSLKKAGLDAPSKADE